jgi:hypothetical protein
MVVEEESGDIGMIEKKIIIKLLLVMIVKKKVIAV